MKNKNLSIGLFATSGLLLFGLGLFLIGDRYQMFAGHREYYSEFVNLAGLSSGARVRVGGMNGGEVLGIEVPDSPSSRFRIKWKIDSKLAGLVRTDSIATIGTEGIVGDTFLAVSPGTAKAAQAEQLATIQGKEPTDLNALLASGNTLIADADGTLKQLGGKLNGTLDTVTATVGNVNDIVAGLKQGRGAAGMLLSDNAFANQLRRNITSTTADVQQIVGDIKAGHGPAGILLRDETIAGQIRTAVNKGQQATANLEHASRQADSLISDLTARQLPQKAGEMIDSLNDTTKQVHQLVAEITQPDQNGMSAGANVRQSLMNVNTASANLADDGEALKHNFLLRGFFRKRGYYNLAGITPEEYRGKKAFSDAKSRRVWMSAAELFRQKANGDEELTEAGKVLLCARLTANGDIKIVSPVVVEGYDQSAQQDSRSRRRAVLVQQFLQTRYQLDTRNVGVVALKNLPPKGTDHSTWDGICVVVLLVRS